MRVHHSATAWEWQWKQIRGCYLLTLNRISHRACHIIDAGWITQCLLHSSSALIASTLQNTEMLIRTIRALPGYEFNREKQVLLSWMNFKKLQVKFRSVKTLNMLAKSICCTGFAAHHQLLCKSNEPLIAAQDRIGICPVHFFYI